MTNCTVSGNYAYGDGGGVAGSGVVSLTNCTVSGNYAYGNGGGLDNFPATATLGNTIVAGTRLSPLGDVFQTRYIWATT